MTSDWRVENLKWKQVHTPIECKGTLGIRADVAREANPCQRYTAPWRDDELSAAVWRFERFNYAEVAGEVAVEKAA